MRRPIAFLVAVILIADFSPCRASTIKSLNDLSIGERMDLQESENRVIAWDRTLQTLDDSLKHKKISRQDFDYQCRDITAYIAAEAELQNTLMTKGGFEMPEGPAKVLRTVGKYSLIGGEYVLQIGAQALASSHVTISP